MIKDIKYTRHFIETMIIRIDFSSFIPSDEVFNENIIDIVVENYPRKDKEQIMRFGKFNIKFNIPNPDSTARTIDETIDGIQREFIDSSGRNKLILSNKYIICEIKNYNGFMHHILPIEKVIGQLFNGESVSTERVGIRYINLWDMRKTRFYKKYFIPSIASALESKLPKSVNDLKCTRSMHLEEYLLNGVYLNFRYGMHNSDYPNELKKRNFILDLDCYSPESMKSSEEIVKFIHEGHDYIQTLFEQSITDALRKIMSGSNRNG